MNGLRTPEDDSDMTAPQTNQDRIAYARQYLGFPSELPDPHPEIVDAVCDPHPDLSKFPPEFLDQLSDLSHNDREQVLTFAALLRAAPKLLPINESVTVEVLSASIHSQTSVSMSLRVTGAFQRPGARVTVDPTVIHVTVPAKILP